MPLLMLFFLPDVPFPTLDRDHNMSKEVKLVFSISIKEQSTGVQSGWNIGYMGVCIGI